MEVGLTQIFDRPLRGREFFEEIIRDNLELGRPDRVQLIFGRKVTKRAPGEFRTRVIQDGVQFGRPRVMALLALTMFQHLIDGFRNRDLRQQVSDLLGLPLAMTCARLKGLIYRPPKTNRCFVTPYGWKVAGCFRGWKLAYCGPPWLCSRPTIPFYRSRCGKPRIASTRNSTY
jgi:hypothetical protein